MIRSALQQPGLRFSKLSKKSNRGKPEIGDLNIGIFVGIGGRVSVQPNDHAVAQVAPRVAGMPL
jgi:hypothetical protein